MSWRIASGAVETMLRIWFTARVRSLRALSRTSLNTGNDSTAPVRVFASTEASPDNAARAAAIASAGSDFPRRRRTCRFGRSTSTT
jgi:hypothetical protein